MVTALCFLPCFFLAPLAAAVPAYATAPVLVLVGVSMFQTVATIDFASLEDALPAFVTVVLIPLTLSITQGILWGFLLHALLYAVAGRARQVPAMLWVLAAISVGLLLLESRARWRAFTSGRACSRPGMMMTWSGWCSGRGTCSPRVRIVPTTRPRKSRYVAPRSRTPASSARSRHDDILPVT